MRYLIITLFALLSCNAIVAQYNNVPTIDGEPIDTLVLLNTSDDDNEIHLKAISISDMKHSPHTATMYAAILPGLGQIYNGKYWKLPILYGGVAALCYSIHFNGKYYDKYRQAYRDFVIRDPNNKSYIEMVNKTNLTLEQVETTYESWFLNVLNNKKNYYRRYRDMSYFGMIGVYVLQIVDATVDAHFFDFNVDDNISMNWSPMIMPDANGGYAGATVLIRF